MKLLIVALCVVGSLARPDVSHLVRQAKSDPEAVILKFELNQDPDGKSYYEFETDNGIKTHEHSEYKNKGTENEVFYKHGINGYVGDDGQNYQIKYNADENGYQPEGAHLPTPPPIPDYIIRSIEYIQQVQSRQAKA